MTPREQFNKLYRSTHRDSGLTRWLTDDAVISEDDIMLQTDGQGKALAGVILKPCDFLYRGQRLDSCVLDSPCNLRDVRGRTAALQLYPDVLAAARGRGEALCSIVPPQRHLYFFYDRFGFATVLYADELRYTALHTFAGGCGSLTEPSARILQHLEMSYGCGTLHSDSDFDHMCRALEAHGDSHVIAAADGEDVAMLCASVYDDNVAVRLCLSDSECLSLTILAELRCRVPDKTFLVDTPPVTSNRDYLRSRGMIRIIDPMPLFDALAESNPDLEYTFRVHDTLIPDNDGYYHIAEGICTRSDGGHRRPDIDVGIATLASVLFSGSAIGEIFNLPTCRPYYSGFA